jgi:small subunit ribosomal protein S20
MAIHKSAKTRIRRNARRDDINTSRMSKTRTGIRKVEEAIAFGDEALAREALRLAQPNIHRSADKNLMHKKTAARKLSRLSARIKALKK